MLFFFFYLIDLLEWNASACLFIIRANMTKTFLLCGLYLLITTIVTNKFAPFQKKYWNVFFLKLCWKTSWKKVNVILLQPTLRHINMAHFIIVLYIIINWHLANCIYNCSLLYNGPVCKLQVLCMIHHSGVYPVYWIVCRMNNNPTLITFCRLNQLLFAHWHKKMQSSHYLLIYEFIWPYY